MSKLQSPNDLLSAMLGRPVVIMLSNGDTVKGILVSIDKTMSCVLEQFERFQNGDLVASYPQSYLRGSNIIYFGVNKQ